MSHCETQSKRELYVKVLQQYIPVQIYGSCSNGTKRAKDLDTSILFKDNAPTFKFYLAFENSLCTDYVTEKLWRTLGLPLVPVVMGGVDYSRIAPPRSVIDVNDFPTVKDLADYLIFLDHNNVSVLKTITPICVKEVHFLLQDEYLKYFEWRKKYKLYWTFAGCSLCRRLHNPNEPVNVIDNVFSWYVNGSDGQTPQCSDGSDRPYYKSMIKEST